SMKADLEKSVYTHQGELNDYIYGSADVVGLMCLKVFVNGDEERYQSLENPAMKLGSAFQKVNFLRDLKADFEGLDRTYFPGFSITTFNDESKALLIKNIEEDFDDAFEGIKKLPGRARLAVLVAFIFYKQLLRKIKQTPASQVITTRVRVSDSQKLFLLSKAMFQYKFNMYF
ncbi:MAG: phytoene/squalene synthase family protein, partial [Bacteroidales bacterium]